jgi:hypothetical protein
MNCQHCDKPIDARRSTKKYCSNTCRQYAYQNRQTILGESNVPSETNFDTVGEAAPLKPIALNENTSLAGVPCSKRTVESDYQYIWPDIFSRIESECLKQSYRDETYFKPASKGGELTPENMRDFSYLCPRVMCILENLFFLSYKKRVYYNTIHILFLAIQAVVLSDQLKRMPEPCPFFPDLCKLYKQMEGLDAILKNNKEGLKFTLDKSTIARFIYVLTTLRTVAERKPFKSLFPDLFNANTS